MKKRYFLILIPIFFVGLIVYVNISDENERYNNPKSGQLYVFDNLLKDKGLIGNNVFKVSLVTKDSISFYIPLVSFPLTATIDEDIISEVRSLDRKDKMFSNQEIQLSKEKIKQYRENASFSKRYKDPSAILLLAVY